MLYEIRDSVATIRLNRPDRLNALDAGGYRALHEAISSFVQDEEARCLVMTGSGRAFCAGQDLDEIPELKERSAKQVRDGLQRIQDMTRMLLVTPKPTLAAINGPAVGAGAEISLAFDLRLGKSGCFFLFPELQHGLFQTNASTHILPRLVGHGRASEWLLLGQRISGQQAYASGLLNSIHEEDAFDDAVLETANRLASLQSHAVALLKRALRENPAATIEQTLNNEIESSMALLPGSND